MNATAAPRGVFVSFEGGDGVGKTTQIRALADWLTGLGHTVVTTREPGGTDLGLELRSAVLHGGAIDPRTEALLYAADRAHHVATVIRPALDARAVVITDRYLDSSVAYQGSRPDLDATEVEHLSHWAAGGLLPDLTVLLDLDPAVGLTRLSGPADRIESAGLQFHRRARRAFLDRAGADPNRFLVVDATHDVDTISARVRHAVAQLLGATAAS